MNNGLLVSSVKAKTDENVNGSSLVRAVLLRREENTAKDALTRDEKETSTAEVYRKRRKEEQSSQTSDFNRQCLGKVHGVTFCTCQQLAELAELAKSFLASRYVNMYVGGSYSNLLLLYPST